MDPVCAFEWFKRAADKGYTPAEYAVAGCYHTGRGVGENEGDAFEYYKCAADKGHVSAQYMLGCCYENGWGTNQDEDEAVRYYQKAAKKGHTNAEYSLGYYFKGEGENDEKYYSAAVKYLKRAADKEHREAQYFLANCYECGLGTDKNEALAVKLYETVALSENDFSGLAKQTVIRMLCNAGRYAKAESMCIKHKWFEVMTEEYLWNLHFSHDEKLHNRFTAWIKRAEEAGYADASNMMR